MNDILFMLADGTAAPVGGSNPLVMIVFMVVFIAFFYFVVIRPQNKKKKEMEIMMNNLKKGDKVVTIGGIMGKVSSVKDNTVVVKVCDNSEITFEKQAIARVVLPQNKNTKIEKKDDKKSIEGRNSSAVDSDNSGSEDGSDGKEESKS
ncbi:MAG TPA: preprotein translocase subunit YajC [Spirochaetota bacterium]|nr:MAG: preprotein translocase subunit YajC [Spirochaetes bacterium ADurb.Bin133]HNZ28336.1 preprotein translocase subunit YajC [Spirochaetota bacterium]HOF01239.1 preprotein translocase subunit YajC [Spirochaetota bacterium]HOS32731.1 preprotein translocase subunit YajC [Spirochaetota bacterium]HOS54613.1 preprotein translocase subunit YajC [Spirochaetota bacterium]